MVLHSCKLPSLSKNKWQSQGKRTLPNSESKYISNSSRVRGKVSGEELSHSIEEERVHLWPLCITSILHHLWKTHCLTVKSHQMGNQLTNECQVTLHLCAQRNHTHGSVCVHSMLQGARRQKRNLKPILLSLIL